MVYNGFTRFWLDKYAVLISHIPHHTFHMWHTLLYWNICVSRQFVKPCYMLGKFESVALCDNYVTDGYSISYYYRVLHLG